MSTCWRVVTRRKVLDPAGVEETRLSRVLNTFDLTALGVGSTLGVGVYVIAGHVAKETAGPAVVLSFLIAAVASVFAGLCYAEFGARVPRAGSAYIYSYVSVGEGIAFIIGWNLILEYVIGSASVARGLSLYLDMLLNNTMQKAFIDVAPIGGTYLSPYFDFFAFGISILLAAALAFGLKQSSLMNNMFTTLNIFVVLFVVIAGSFKADTSNWSISPNSTNSTGVGEGGFFPFGVEGMIKGAATCFYGFVGFDCIATTGEEVKNPRRAIPISIIASLFVIFLAYLGTSTVITLMVPYYLQDSGAPLPYAFDYVGWDWAKWVASIGGIFGQCASLFGAMFPLPRILYAMANDSLVFRFLGRVNSRFQTPVIGTLLAGILTGTMAGVFKLKQLVDMMSLGTFLAYTIVAACVLILRYAKEETRRYLPVQTTSDSDDSDTYTDRMDMSQADGRSTEDLLDSDSVQLSGMFGSLVNSGRIQSPTRTSEAVVRIEVCLFCISCVLIALCARFFNDDIVNGDILSIVLTSLSTGMAVILILSITLQPTSKQQLSFKVPWVPLIPALSILINVYLMVMLDSLTWIRFAVWMVIGIPTYCFSVRLYTEAENRNISEKGSLDTQVCGSGSSTPKQNGRPNHAFEEKIERELERFDEMLDEVVYDLDNDDNRSRVSVGSVSVSDVNVPCEESVVAVVHRDNVVTPVAEKSFFPDQKVPERDSESSVEPPETPESLDDPPSDQIESDESIKDPIDHFNIIESVPDDPKTPNGLINHSITKSLDAIDNLESLNLAGNPIQTPESPGNLPSDPIESDGPIKGPTAPNGLTLAIDSIPRNDLESPIQTPPPPPPPPPLTPQTPTGVPRPTSAHLASVTLRRPKGAPQVSEEPYVPDDDNLRIGSDKYKAFKQNLDDKLKRISAIPSYIPFVATKERSPEPEIKEKIPNENVIEDSIDRDVAKEKLGVFVSSWLNDNQEKRERPKVKFDVIIAPEGDFIEHKNRMNNVFRSMNIKHTDSFVKDPEGIRNKSWGFINDDIAKHRVAMSEIFKTIELRGKDDDETI